MPLDDVTARWASRPVPRYTSYPTAPHFQPNFPEASWRNWLGALDPAEPVSLYLHVPFCRKMCWYCGCNMKLAARYDPISAYVETLLAEIDLLAAALPERMAVSHLHWGGGTPNTLSPDDLARVMTRLRARFHVTGDAELALEVDPRILGAEMAARIGALGFTRASLGVQEFDPAVQAAINREQPPEMVAEAVGMLRAAGVRGINLDLLYGLPHQTVATLERSIAECARLRPDRVALFGYAHVPWMARNQRLIPEAALPDAAARAAQASAAAAALAGAGYQAIGLDHFALPDDPMAVVAREGRLRRNFQGYTTDAAATLLGLGVTAISRTPAGFMQAEPETGAWRRAVEAGRLPVHRGRALTAEDRLRGGVIERLMCDGAVDTAAAARLHGAGPDWCAAERARLRAMERDGLVRVEGPRVTLTEAGRPLARVVASVFDAYLEGGAARHSVAV
jgi:oxygen-independent coproporphyrinogen-3 oxidase